jgi:hypothetical protein
MGNTTKAKQYLKRERPLRAEQIPDLLDRFHCA